MTLAIEDHHLMMISAGPFFKVNPSVSFMVSCTSRDEVRGHWEVLSADPAAEQCGWLKDKLDIQAYNNSQNPHDRDICQLLAKKIDHNLPENEETAPSNIIDNIPISV